MIVVYKAVIKIYNTFEIFSVSARFFAGGTCMRNLHVEMEGGAEVVLQAVGRK